MNTVQQCATLAKDPIDDKEDEENHLEILAGDLVGIKLPCA